MRAQHIMFTPCLILKAPNGTKASSFMNLSDIYTPTTEHSSARSCHPRGDSRDLMDVIARQRWSRSLNARKLTVLYQVLTHSYWGREPYGPTYQQQTSGRCPCLSGPCVQSPYISTAFSVCETGIVHRPRKDMIRNDQPLFHLHKGSSREFR